MKTLFCFGTRPEAIKMAPLIKEFEKRNADFEICITAQHREMLDQVLSFFSIEPHHDLDLMTRGQSLNQLNSLIFQKTQEIFERIKPDLVMVQGDTNTALCVAIAAFNLEIKVGHVEAGLRTYDLKSPFPEEANRQMISRVASFHFAPTKKAHNNLLQERIEESKIYLTGNTIVDALNYAKEILNKGYESDEILKLKDQLDPRRKLVLVTGHRRENFKNGLEELCRAISDLAKSDNVQFIFPVHPNPEVTCIVNEKLKANDNILLTPPLEYTSLLWIIKRSHFIISDSGGIQEEAPGFSKRVLITRNNTERMEGIEEGFHILVKPEYHSIIEESEKLLNRPIILKDKPNPFGDGKAAVKIADILLERSI